MQPKLLIFLISARDLPTDNIATQLAAFAHGLKPDMLPAAVVEQAKLLMLDALGIALASSGQDFAQRPGPDRARLRH